MGRAFEFRKARKMKRWSSMAKTFTRIGKDIVIAVKDGGPNPETNSKLRAVIQNAKTSNMPKDNIQRAIKNASELKDFNGGELILCPPSALHDRWSQKFKDTVKGFVSGWMTIKQRIKQKNINLPIVISDHADWKELTDTIKEVSPEKVFENQIIQSFGR